MKTCANCSTEFDLNYCHHCGQKAIKERLTIKYLLTDFVFSFFHLEKKGLLFTVKEMFVRPGFTAKDYIEGKRQRFYPPMKLLILAGTIIVIASLRYNFFSNDFSDKSSDITVFKWLNLSQNQEEFFDQFFEYAEHYATFLNIVAIPIFSLFSYLFFIKYKYNFAENLILNTFITAEQLLFLIVLIPFLEFFPESKVILIQSYSVATILYNIWGYTQFFEGAWWKDAILGIFVVFFAYISQFVINSLVFAIIKPWIHLIPSH